MDSKSTALTGHWYSKTVIYDDDNDDDDDKKIILTLDQVFMGITS